MNIFFSFKEKDQGKLYKVFFDTFFKRTLFEAIVLYIFQVLTMYMVILIISKIFGSFIMETLVSSNIRLIFIGIVVFYVVLVELSLLKRKNLLHNKFYLFIIAFAAILTVFFGGLVGLLPIIYFAMQAPYPTRKKK